MNQSPAQSTPLSQTTQTQIESPSILVVGINSSLGLEITTQLSQQKLTLYGLESKWFSNPLYRLTLPSQVNVLTHYQEISQPVNYLLILGDIGGLDQLLSSPLVKHAKIFTILPDSSANYFFQHEPGQDPSHCLKITPTPFKHLTQSIIDHSKSVYPSQLIYVRDLVQPIDNQTLLSPLQALYIRVSDQQLLLAANQAQQVSPITLDDGVKLIIRIMFGKTQPTITHVITGSHPQPLINLAFNLQNSVRNQLNRQFDIIPLPGLDINLPQINPHLITPKRSQNIETALYQTLHQVIKQQQVISQNQLQSTPPPIAKPVSVVVPKAPPTPPPPQRFVAASPPPKPPTPELPVAVNEPIAPVRTITKNSSTTSTAPRWNQAAVSGKTHHRSFTSSPKKSVKWSLFVFGLLILIITLFLILTYPFLKIYKYHQTSFNIDLEKASKTSIQQTLNQTQQASQTVTKNLRLIQKSPLIKLPLIAGISQKFILISQQAQINLQLNLAKLTGLEALAIILGNKPGDPYPSIKESQDRLFLVYGMLSKQLETAAQIQNQSNLDTNTQALVSQLNQELPLLKNKILNLHQFLSTYPKLIKPNQKTNLLVLLQNHHELRPTGGFLDGVIVVGFDNGKLINLDAQNIYTLDGQLKGQVDPPADLAKLIGETSWYYRDVNWDPDFPNTAKNAEWFLEKTSSQTAIATLAETSLGIKNLLDSSGEIELSTKQTINSQNFLSQLLNEPTPQLLNQNTHLPILVDTYQSLFNHFQKADKATQLKLLNTWFENLSHNQTQFSTRDRDTLSTLIELGWAGELVTPVCPTQLSQNSCTVDYFYLNEANIGVNRANATIERQEKHQINLLPDSINHSHSVTYINSAQSTNWPAGDYKAYLRAYLPSNAVLNRVLVNSKALESEQISINSEHSKSVIGFSLTVPHGDSTTLEISYNLPQVTSTTNNSNYTFLIQKQPGVEAGKLALSLKHPESLTAIPISHPFTPINNTLSLDLTNDQDLFFAIELKP